jgi:hypothetical protein
MSALKDLTGRVFGRLTVLRRRAEDLNGRVAWIVKCECGNEHVVNPDGLVRGATKSCGCLAREVAARIKTKHGMHGSSEHQCWANMVARCTNPKKSAYADYGARGIKVCERWREFENFIADMGARPPGTSIERLDVNGDYEPGNCVWATDETQANNKRGLRKYLVDGEWLTASQLGRRWGISQKQAKERASGYESKIIGAEKGQNNG